MAGEEDGAGKTRKPCRSSMTNLPFSPQLLSKQSTISREMTLPMRHILEYRKAAKVREHGTGNGIRRFYATAH